MGDKNNATTGAAFKVHGRAATRNRGRGHRRTQPVAVTRLDPAAEQLALHLAGGDRRRLVVVSVGIVIVVNRPRGVSAR